MEPWKATHRIEFRAAGVAEGAPATETWDVMLCPDPYLEAGSGPAFTREEWGDGTEDDDGIPDWHIGPNAVGDTVAQHWARRGFPGSRERPGIVRVVALVDEPAPLEPRAVTAERLRELFEGL